MRAYRPVSYTHLDVYKRQPLQRVLFPAFSTLQNDPDRFRDAISRSCRLLALLFMPVGFGLAAVAPELVPVLYGCLLYTSRCV